MKRICIVVQRYGKDIVGGAEQLARCYAHLLKTHYEIHVATTCAEDYERWKNHFPPGISDDEGVVVHRFPNDFERTGYWHQLHTLLLLRHILDFGSGMPPGYLLAGWSALWAEASAKARVKRAAALLPRAIQEEFIREQGPYSTGLCRFLEAEQDRFDAFLFVTYLYPTTYFGAPFVPQAKRILVPTLHDEPSAYLPVYRNLLNSFDRLVFLSTAEEQLARSLCGWSGPCGAVIGMPVELLPAQVEGEVPDSPYLLYCGRIDRIKGADILFEYFLRFKQERPTGLKLLLTGKAVGELPKDPSIRFLGFVKEGHKRALMHNAVAFVHPSPFESFSIVLLESFLEGTPALVNSESTVMSEHCRVAKAGLAFSSYEEFREHLSRFIADRNFRDGMGQSGRRYVRENYSPQRISAKLREMIERKAVMAD